MPSLQQKLCVSIAGWTEPASADSDLKLDCTQGDEGPTILLAELGQDRQGWVGLKKWLSLPEKDRSQSYMISLVGIGSILRAKNDQIIQLVSKCIEATSQNNNAFRTSKDSWIISMSLKDYLSLKRCLSYPEYKTQSEWFQKWEPLNAPSLLPDSSSKNESATRWQLQWAGFHPDALDFVCKNQRVLPDEVPSDYRQLKPGIIRRLTNRESPTIFDRIWDDLDDISQHAIIKVIRDRLKQAPPELTLLKEFGFYETDKEGNLIRWFSPLFEAYVYHYKTYSGIFRRMARIREFADGIADLLEKTRKWKPDIFVLRLLVALTVIVLVMLISRSISSFWGLAFISTLGLLFTMATLWPHFLQLRQSLNRSRWLLAYLGFLVVVIVFLQREGRELALRSSTVDQDQIGLVLGIIQVMPMLFLLPKILAKASDLIEKILPPGK